LLKYVSLGFDWSLSYFFSIGRDSPAGSNLDNLVKTLLIFFSEPGTVHLQTVFHDARNAEISGIFLVKTA